MNLVAVDVLFEKMISSSPSHSDLHWFLVSLLKFKYNVSYSQLQYLVSFQKSSPEYAQSPHKKLSLIPILAKFERTIAHLKSAPYYDEFESIYEIKQTVDFKWIDDRVLFKLPRGYVDGRYKDKEILRKIVKEILDWAQFYPDSD